MTSKAVFRVTVDRSGGTGYGYSPECVWYFEDHDRAARIARIARKLTGSDNVRVIRCELR